MRHRLATLAALVAASASCDEPVVVAPPPPVRWSVPPAPVAVSLGRVVGKLGRSQPPQPLLDLGLWRAPASGPATLASEADAVALRDVAVWSVGDGRAVVAGTGGVELVEVDRGRVLWRSTACKAPVVGATAEAIVCGDASGVQGLGRDGAATWTVRGALRGASAGRVVVEDAGAIVVLDAASGAERARYAAMPRGLAASTVVAACDDEVFAVSAGALLRLVARGGALAVAWRATVEGGAIAGLASSTDACAKVVTVELASASGASLVALARESGKAIGRVDEVAGWWPAREGDGIEVATATGVARYPSTLDAAQPLALAPLGALIAMRGDARLVRATPLTAVLLDRRGVRGYVALAARTAALGEAAIVAGGATARRFAMPAPWTRQLRLPSMRRGVARDAELRDLPPLRPLDIAAAIALPDTGRRGALAHALDPEDGAAVYAAAIAGGGAPSAGGAGDNPAGPAAIARFDLAGRRWRWQRVDGCGAGAPVGVVVAAEVVACATTAQLRATSRDGAARWDWTAPRALDGVIGGGALVVARAGDRAFVLDGETGALRAQLASDDGAAPRMAVIVVGGTTWLVAVEGGRITARVGRGLVPVWSIAVAGSVYALTASGAGVLVALEDGDAYRVALPDAAVTALPGLGLGWQAAGDVVVGHTRGGPIPGAPLPDPPPTLNQLLRKPMQVLRAEIETPAPMSTPIAPPPSRGDSWQLTLYELAGGLRARNDYALGWPVGALAPRGPAGSPLVVPYGQRDVLVLDPRTGDPVRRVRLPDDAAPGAVFATVVDGAPIAGVLLGSPLRVVAF